MSNQLYQYSIISALMDGVASGGIVLSNLQALGNYGLGTFESIDGEMVMIDSISYHLRADGSIETATADNSLPFAMVTHFKPTLSRTASLSNKDDIYINAKDMFPRCDNLYLALKIEGTFRRMKVRAVRGQTYKGQPLAELGDSQSINTFKEIKGTVFGFRSPPFSQGISVAGGHLHFLSADRDCGGHVLELEAENVEISGAAIKDVRIELPESTEFNEAKLEMDAGGIQTIENAVHQVLPSVRSQQKKSLCHFQIPIKSALDLPPGFKANVRVVKKDFQPNVKGHQKENTSLRTRVGILEAANDMEVDRSGEAVVDGEVVAAVAN